jgi:putative chitinase
MKPSELLRIMPNAGKQADLFAPHLAAAFARFQINTPERQASFLSQIGHESGELNRLSENLVYRTPARLRAVWPSRFPTLASTTPYIGNAPALANKVYASRMGNGDEASGDGFRFRGRGLLMITGRENYDKCGAACGYDLVKNPQFLDSPALACLSAGWFWSSHGLNEIADTGDQERVTRRVNGGITGLAQRLAMFDLAYRVLTQ